jgi:tetratricopeptide (TPR) repeat protein
MIASFALPLLALLSDPFRPSDQDATTPNLDAIWKDPVFQRQFVGGYGINADVEPRVTPEEVAVLEKVRPLMANEPAKAEELLRKAIKPETSAVLDFTLGALQFQRENLAGALENYQKAVTKFPSFRRAWRNLGWIQVKRGEHDAAITAFTRMIELGGADAYSYGLLGFAYSAKEDYQPAEAAYRNALLLQPDNTEWRLGVTRCVFKQEKFADAAALLEVLIERFPDKAEFWLLQAQAFLGLKEPLRAAQDLEAVARLGKSTADSLYTLGDIYLSETLLDLALGAYQRAIERDPAQPIARALRSAELLSSKSGMAQAKVLAQAIERASGAQLAEADRRKLLKLQARLSMAEGGGTSETAAVLEEIVRLDPLDGDALLLLGHYYARASEPDRAILYYQRAASVEAFESTAKIFHAQILVGQGRYAEALPLLRRAQEVKPREDVARYLEQVERLTRSRG